jgi:uncharacterized protein YndB with AHSA1/START domain
MTYILASPELVYEALTTAEGIRKWWTTDADLGAEVGDLGVFRFHEGKTVTEVRIDKLRPGTRVEWTVISSRDAHWAGTTITFELDPEGDETGVFFAHRGFVVANRSFAMTNSNWAGCLASLQEYLEIGVGTPQRPKDFSEMTRSRADAVSILRARKSG